MTEASTDKPNQTGTIALRAICLYLLLYFTFISDFASNYRIIWHVDHFLKAISNRIGEFLNKAFFPASFKEWRFFDSYWTYSKLLFFLFVSISVAIVWTMADKGKRSRKLFLYMHTFSRYYLGIAMLLYSMWKLFEIQFYLEPKNFMLPIGYYGPRALFWTFIASSRSYPMFGGLIEAVAGGLLLFRRTSTLGALLSSAILFDILIMDTAYDTPIKVIVFHLMLFSAFIASPDALKIFGFLVQGKAEKLTEFPPAIGNKGFRKWGYAIKTLFIATAIIPMLISNRAWINRLNHPPYENIVGVHEIDSTGLSAIGTAGAYHNPKQWKKMAIEAENAFHVVTPADSIESFKMDVDTAAGRLTVMSGDSTIFCRLHYKKMDSTRCLFEGSIGADSIRFVSRLVDIHKQPLLRENGKIIWSWITPP